MLNRVFGERMGRDYLVEITVDGVARWLNEIWVESTIPNPVQPEQSTQCIELYYDPVYERKDAKKYTSLSEAQDAALVASQIFDEYAVRVVPYHDVASN